MDSAQTNNGALAARVAKVIADQMGIDQSTVTPDKRLVADLGADSLDSLEIVMGIEDEFDLLIEDEDAEACSTVADVIGLVSRYLAPIL